MLGSDITFNPKVLNVGDQIILVSTCIPVRITIKTDVNTYTYGRIE